MLLDGRLQRNMQCDKSVGSIATKSMKVKNGGNTIDAVVGLALWVSHCISRARGLAGGSSLVNRTDFYSIPVSNEIFNSLTHS